MSGRALAVTGENKPAISDSSKELSLHSARKSLNRRVVLLPDTMDTSPVVAKCRTTLQPDC